MMQKKQSYGKEILKLAGRDIQAGLYQNRWKFLWVVPLVCIFFFNYCQQVNGFFENGVHTFSPSFMDFCLYLFKGRIFTFNDPRTRYEIPVMWLTTQMYALYLIGSYASDDRTRLGQQYLLRCTHVTSWYLAKLIYGIVCVALFYLEILVLAFLLTVPFSKQIFTLHPDLVRMSTNIHLERHTTWDLYRGIFVMPCLTAIVLGQGYILLQLLVRPIYAYVGLLLYILSSDYYMSNFLIGNFSMIARNRQEGTFDGMVLKSADPTVGLLIEIGIMIAIGIAGRFVLKKYDYLDRA